MYYNFTKHKEFFFLDLFVYLIPFAIIIGNLALNSIIFISIVIFYFLILTKKEYLDNYKIFFYVLFILISFFLLNLIFSYNTKLSLIALINFIKNYSMFLIILFCISEIDYFKEIFTKILFFLVIFVLFDVTFQHFFLVDIFGYEISSSHGRRLTGPFGDESVAGTFISKLFFISTLAYINLSLFRKILIPLMMVSLIIVILTNERSASIMFFFTLLIFFVFFNKKFLTKFLIIITVFVIIFSLFNNNNGLKTHFLDVPVKAFKDNHHKAHYLTAIEIFKEHKILGSGVKTFREICKKEKYELIDSKFSKNRCSTHPHNIYFEILSETGLLGFIIFFIINIYILFYLIIKFYVQKKLKIEILILFCNFYILFWPLQTTGAFFSTWNGIFYWIFFSYFFYYRRKLTV